MPSATIEAPPGLDRADTALLSLLQTVVATGYRFVTITPASHARVLRRAPDRRGTSLTDVFGWSLPFEDEALPAAMLRDLRVGDMLDAGLPHRSRVRISTVRDRPYFHSAYPTEAADAVFLGPDSYRFADLIAAELVARPLAAGGRIADIGTGSGVGAITAAGASPSATTVATDINRHALRLARINAAAAGVALDTVETSGLTDVPGPFDLILLNPPYIVDAAARAYRHGGGMHGTQLALDLTTAALPALAPNGRLILYTGSPIIAGGDPLRQALDTAAAASGCTLHYRELDPDVFGEELDTPAYAEVDRIALVAAIFTRLG